MGRYRTIIGVAGLAGLLAWLYYPVVGWLLAEWLDDISNLGYGFFIPPVAAYLVWERWHTLRPDSRGSWWGYVLLIFGLLCLILGRTGGARVIAEASLIFVLFGLSLFLGGWGLVKPLAFPLIFLALMIPLPPALFNHITWPLQIFTARFSTAVLHFAGYPVLLQGVYIDLPNVRLEVAAACSGFRSLIALGATAVMLAFMTRLRWTDRAVLIASVLPIAILSNAVRVTSNILLGFYEGMYHTLAGWTVFVVATVCLMGVQALLAKRTASGLPV
ncbi:MAG TPA: exosortase/archaeosortase family protein [bacterium]|nr:exosortase/archaeosortase family protein [bacterium]